MTRLSALKNQAAAVDQALGFKAGYVARIISRVSDEYLESILQETKSYDLNFRNWSKLWS